MRSSTRSLSGLVIILFVNPVPALLVVVQTMLAPTNRSLAFFVVTEPLLLLTTVPVPATAASKGLAESRPLYSATRMSA
jgi:hypothetical protein